MKEKPFGATEPPKAMILQLSLSPPSTEYWVTNWRSSSRESPQRVTWPEQMEPRGVDAEALQWSHRKFVL